MTMLEIFQKYTFKKCTYLLRKYIFSISFYIFIFSCQTLHFVKQLVRVNPPATSFSMIALVSANYSSKMKLQTTLIDLCLFAALLTETVVNWLVGVLVRGMRSVLGAAPATATCSTRRTVCTRERTWDCPLMMEN